MKKQLLTICAALAAGTVFAQTPSTDWSTNQQAVFPTSPAPSATAAGIDYMDAVDQNVIWVVGSDWATPSRNYNWFSRSTNGGSSFTGGYIYSVSANPSVSDTNTYIIANLDAIDANTAWVSAFMKSTQSQGAIHRTTNGGAGWVNMTATGMFTNSAAFTNMVVFLTPSVGIAQGDPVNGEYEIWRTTNGGLSWALVPGSNIPDPISGEFSIVDLYYELGSSYMWFGTNAGRMYRTTDAGVTWSVATVGSTSDVLLEIAFSSPLHGLTYVFNGTSIDVYNTTDGGANWTNITTSISGNIGYADIKGIPGTGKIASFGVGTSSYLSYSSDNGVTWIDWGSSNIQYQVGDFVDNTTGWAGSHNFPQSPNFTNIWKYSGSPISGTTTPLVSFTMPSEVCYTGSAITLTPSNTSSSTPAPTYSWSASPAGASFSSPTATNPTITFNSANSYTIALTANNGFTSTTAYHVINVVACSLPSVSFSLASNTVCNGFQVSTTNSSSGGNPAPSYSWSAAGSGNITFSPSPIATNPSVIATPGTYTIYLVGSNVLGTVQATQQVTVNNCAPTAAFALEDTVVLCAGTKSIAINAANMTQTVQGAGVNTYTWSISPQTGIQALTGPNAPNYSVVATNTNVTSYTFTLRARNASGTTSVTSVIKVLWNDPCTGIAESEWLTGVDVYPNPASKDITVGLPEGGSATRLTITNVLGSVLIDRPLNEKARSVQLELGDQPRGVYLLSIETKNARITKKIILE